MSAIQESALVEAYGFGFGQRALVGMLLAMFLMGYMLGAVVTNRLIGRNGDKTASLWVKNGTEPTMRLVMKVSAIMRLDVVIFEMIVFVLLRQ